MLIDWFTVGGQALNFLILVWLLKRFLYKPMLQAIDAREKLIAAELADATAKKAEAQKDRDEFQHKNDTFDQERSGLLSRATREAKAERTRLIEAGRKEADVANRQRQETFKKEADQLAQALRRRTQQEVFAIARKTLIDLSSASLEERMCEVFNRRVCEMTDPQKTILATALKTASEPALVRSVFELSAEKRATIQKALNETFSAAIPLRFETAGDLVSGIEFTTNGQKLAWSISAYLTALEKGVGEILNVRAKPEPTPEVKVEVEPEPVLTS